jgi:hypothetical protein
MFKRLYRKGSAMSLNATLKYVESSPQNRTMFLKLLSMQMSSLLSRYSQIYVIDDELSPAKKLVLTLLTLVVELDRHTAMQMFGSSQKEAIQMGKQFGKDSPAYWAMLFISNFMQTVANLPNFPQQTSGPELQCFQVENFFASKDASAYIPYSLALRDWFEGIEEVLLREAT